MLLKDITPKHLVLGQVIDDFSDATTKVNYDIEDLCCYVINNIECYYWLNIESIWGPLGFVWDSINNYGHFNRNNLVFSKIPSVPDGHRIKLFQNTFENLYRNIEVYKSNWENVSRFDNLRVELYGVFIFNSDYKIPYIHMNRPKFRPIDNKSGFLFRFVLDETIINIRGYYCIFILDNESYKYYPFKQVYDEDTHIAYNVYENIKNPFTLCIAQFKPDYIHICNNIDEFHFNIDYLNFDNKNYYQFSFDSSDIASNCTFYFYGINSNKDGIFNIYTNYYVKDIVFINIDDIRDKSISFNVLTRRIKRHYWYDIDRRLYNKFNGYFEYDIQFDTIDEMIACDYNFNLNNNTTIWLNSISLLNNYRTTYAINYGNETTTFYNFNFFPKYEYVTTKNFINNISLRSGGNDYYRICLYINEEEVTTSDRLYLFNENVKKVYGIKNAYHSTYSNDAPERDNYNCIDIRKKEYIVLNGDFNSLGGDADYKTCNNCLIGTYDDNHVNYFNVDEVKPFDVSFYTKDNIKKYHVDYLGVYELNTDIFTVTQPLIVSDVNEVYNEDLVYCNYINETIFGQLNNCEIRYIYRCKLVVNKDSILTNDKFIEIINAYIFDNNIESAKGITLQIYTTYFNLIPEDKINQFINDGYIINEIIN